MYDSKVSLCVQVPDANWIHLSSRYTPGQHRESRWIFPLSGANKTLIQWIDVK
jgi:hypothetical protein